MADEVTFNGEWAKLITNGQLFAVQMHGRNGTLYYENFLSTSPATSIPIKPIIAVLKAAGLVQDPVAPKEDRSILGMALCIALEELTDSNDPTTLQYIYMAPIPLTKILDTDPIDLIKVESVVIKPEHIVGIFEALKTHTQKVLPYSEELMRKGIEYDRLYDLYIDEQKRNAELEEKLAVLTSEVV